jgi:chemotaxis protein methyltransferase WspC
MTQWPGDTDDGGGRDLVSAALRRWIRDATGLLITDDNAAPVDLALRVQAEQLRLTPEQLRGRLLSGAIGAQGFIDEITTHESYFFRAREQMQLVVERIIPERLRRAPGRRVRVLSLPCARGEEPYSLAILCEEAGIPATLVEIVGGDIAHGCIEAARAGVFGPLALRRTDPARAGRWFRRDAGQSLRLDPGIVGRVELRRVNLLRDAERLLRGPFDVVFCENLLIYFDADNVERALQVLERLLAEDGWLFVDHSEWNLPRERFRMQELDGRVGFRPRGTTVAGRARVTERPARAAPVPAPAARATPAPAPAAGAPQAPATGRSAAAAPRPAAAAGPAGSARRPRPGAAPGWRRQIEEAEAAYAHKRFPDALLGFEQVLRLRPALPEALLGKARVLADCGEDIEAMELLESLVAAGAAAQPPGAWPPDPSPDAGRVQVDALGLMAVLLHKKGLRDLAAQYLRRVSLLDPSHLALRLLGRRADD